MRLITCFIAFWLVSFGQKTIAQSTVIDSLESLLPATKEDTNKVNILCDLAFYLYNINPNQSQVYSNEALELSKKLNYKNGECNALYKIGIAKMTLGDFPGAIQFTKDALELAELNGNKKYVENSLNVLGILYTDIGNHDEALTYLFKSVESAELSKDTNNIATSYLNIGKIYLDNDDNENAGKYFFEAVKLYELVGNKMYLAYAYNSLSTVQNDIDKKEEYLLKSIELSEATGNSYYAAFAYGNYGGFLYEFRKDEENAINFYRKSMDAANQFGDVDLRLQVAYEFGQVMFNVGKLDSAKYFLNECIVLTDDGSNELTRKKTLQQLSEIHQSENNFNLAYEALYEAQVLADSLQKKEREKQLASADARFEVSKKESQIAAQELEIAQQQITKNRLVIGGLILLVLLAAIFQYFFYKQKQKKKETELSLELEHREAQRLRETDQLKTRFFTNISHELRTPLTLIISPLEEALRKLKQVNLEPDIKLAHQNSQHLLGLINEILDLSKMEAGKLNIQKTELDLMPSLRRILFSFQSAADLKGVRLNFTNSVSKNLTLNTDARKLEKILNNLISNALKFTPKGGEIQLAVNNDHSGMGLNIEVSDTGKGIPEEDITYIFDRFYQSKNATEGGTGIGLALAHQLSQLLEGELTVQSKIGKGSRFNLRLPPDCILHFSPLESQSISKVQLPAETIESATTYQPILLNGIKPRLLIVEDNVDMANYLKNSLSKQYDCTVAADGELALTALKNGQFDLITSDVMMPNMDGFAFREKVNENSHWQKIPFILLTARTLESDKLKGFQLGIDDYITKPFSLPELEARIHNLLDNKQLRDQLSEEPSEELVPDDQLLISAERLVMENMEDTLFSVEILAKKLGYSQRQLSRVFGKLTGLTPVKFILELRLQKARQLLESGKYATVAEVQYEIGIESASYFTKKFTERFGSTPKAYSEKF